MCNSKRKPKVSVQELQIPVTRRFWNFKPQIPPTPNCLGGCRGLDVKAASGSSVGNLLPSRCCSGGSWRVRRWSPVEGYVSFSLVPLPVLCLSADEMWSASLLTASPSSSSSSRCYALPTMTGPIPSATVSQDKPPHPSFSFGEASRHSNKK